MARTNTLVRTLHDAGLAAWFGGALMGAVGVNGAADDVREPTERLRVANAGWAPVNAVAIGAHLIGGAGLLRANADRVRNEPGVKPVVALKSVVTGAALATTAYAGVLGRRTAAGVGHPARGGVTPAPETPAATAEAQRRLRIVQWVVPALTGVLVVLAAQQGEQQRPVGQVGAWVHRLAG
ncbi:hypothetical protein [Pseudonocardia sp. ICBG1293]|uniref:hypothetical protein n=1 Tax=Pseudonocardia sp. ICBG1293 TaxID=2844382 RepID=UPI001CCFF2C4|nr:hypothetical protein [Pseudonocardia sp. ICBG1293]